MRYPIVFDRFETTFTGMGLAVLENASEVKRREVVNGEYGLSFVLPRNDPKWAYVVPENFVLVEGQVFRIRTFDEQRDGQGRLLANVQCEHVWFDAIDCKFIPQFEMVGAQPRDILTAAFEGTRFSVGTVDIVTPTDIFLGKTNPARVVQELVSKVGGELLRDNWTIHLLSRRGSDKGVRFRVGKNAVGVKKTTESKGLVTRLYAFGKDDLDISSVNGGKGYLDSPFIGRYDYVHADYREYKDIEDPTELRAKGLGEFSTADRDGVDKPKVTYEFEVLELKRLAEYGDFERFGLGDNVRCIDEGLGIDVNARVVEYDAYVYEPKRSRVVLANFRDNIGDLLAGLVQSKNRFENTTDSRGRIKADWLQNIKEQLSTEIQAGLLKKSVVHDYGDIWLDDAENPTQAMAIVNGIFAIADSKKANGDWDWQSFGTGRGFTADLINVGKLKAEHIDTINLFAERLYQPGYPSNYGQVGGIFGGLELYFDNQKYFDVMYQSGGAPYAKFDVLDNTFLISKGYSSTPFGTWNFANATVTGLPNQEWGSISNNPFDGYTPYAFADSVHTHSWENILYNPFRYYVPQDFAVSGHGHSEYIRPYYSSNWAYVDAGSTSLVIRNSSGTVIGVIPYQ